MVKAAIRIECQNAECGNSTDNWYLFKRFSLKDSRYKTLQYCNTCYELFRVRESREILNRINMNKDEGLLETPVYKHKKKREKNIMKKKNLVRIK